MPVLLSTAADLEQGKESEEFISDFLRVALQPPPRRQISTTVINDYKRSTYMGAMLKFCLDGKNITAPNYCWYNVIIVSLYIFLYLF